MEPLIERIATDFRMQEESAIIRAVGEVGIRVDKPRLLQALTDARAFYEEGYRTAINNPNMVEVVRCKDCKHWQVSVDGIHTWCSKRVSMATNKDDFCSYGERKDDDIDGCTFYKGLATTVNPSVDYCSYGAKMDGKDGEGK